MVRSRLTISKLKPTDFSVHGEDSSVDVYYRQRELFVALTDLPRLISRGHIEALKDTALTWVMMLLPRLISRGHIEAQR